MTDEVIETVLQEILEEQKEAIKTNQQLIAKIEYLSNQIQSINRKQNNGEVITHVDTKALLEIVSQGINNINQIIAEQPKNVIHQKRFLFFPESHAKEYYSVVLRWSFYIIIASYSYWLLKYIIDHWRQ